MNKEQPEQVERWVNAKDRMPPHASVCHVKTTSLISGTVMRGVGLATFEKFSLMRFLNSTTLSQNNLEFKTEWLEPIPSPEQQPKEPEELREFLAACINERNNFCDSINSTSWSTTLRTMAEDILIMYDQLMQRLENTDPQQPTEGMYTEDEMEKAFIAARLRHGCGDFDGIYKHPTFNLYLSSLQPKQPLNKER